MCGVGGEEGMARGNQQDVLGFKPIPECANLDSRVSDQGKIRNSTY